MPFLRNIVHDLVEKRLWPLAILLAAALVAVPTVLKSHPEAASAPAPGASAGGSAGTADVLDAVALAKPERTRLRLDGGRRNPFQEPGSRSKAGKSLGLGKKIIPLTGVRPLTATPTGGLGSNGSSGTSGTSGTSGSSGTSGGSGAPLGGTQPPPLPEGQQQPTGVPTWTLDASFGPVEQLTDLTAIRPGMGIPSNDDPLLVFVGSTDGKTATFLPSSDAVPQGDGTCLPSRRACNELKLKPGQTAFFDIATDSGTKQYVLEVTKLVKRPL